MIIIQLRKRNTLLVLTSAALNLQTSRRCVTSVAQILHFRISSVSLITAPSPDVNFPFLTSYDYFCTDAAYYGMWHMCLYNISYAAEISLWFQRRSICKHLIIASHHEMSATVIISAVTGGGERAAGFKDSSVTVRASAVVMWRVWDVQTTDHSTTTTLAFPSTLPHCLNVRD